MTTGVATGSARWTRLREVAREQGRTMNWVCRQMGYSRSSVYTRLSGKVAIDDHFVAAACRVLGVEADALFFWPDDADQSARRRSNGAEEAAD